MRLFHWPFPTDCVVCRHRNKKQDGKDKKRYRLKRAIQRAVMRNIIASDSSFSSDVLVTTVKKKNPAGMCATLTLHS